MTKSSNSSPRPGGAAPKKGRFKDLIDLENRAFSGQKSTAPSPIFSDPERTEEPWVAFTTDDHVGLALSGGGIRSATFNLGLLQALAAQKQFFEHLHYLATVSGGGYIGGFWTRWWRDQPQANKSELEKQEHTPVPGSKIPSEIPTQPQVDKPLVHKRFPDCAGTPLSTTASKQPKEIREPPQVRHLREFSRFLIPRKGLNAEFWTAVITILSGLIPSLMAALSAILLAMTLWAVLATWLTRASTYSSGIVLGALLILVLGCSGFRTISKDKPSSERSISWFITWSTFAFISYLAGWFILQPWARSSYSFEWLAFPNNAAPYAFGYSLFAPCIAIVIPLALLTIFRMCVGRRNPKKQRDPKETIALSAELERVMGHLLAIQALWAALAGIWETARWLVIRSDGHQNTPDAYGLGGVTAVLTLLFYWSRNWLKKQKASEGDSPILKQIKLLKPFVPQILANGIVILIFLLSAVLLLRRGLPDDVVYLWWWGISAMCLAIQLFVLVFFDPSAVGLHEFYRARLARCYLGAHKEKPTQDWVEQPDDDIPLCYDTDLPIHLICCTANQCGGDPLRTLHRGARSVVLSRNGIALGDYYVSDNNLRLSSAMTASAAAFNSLMGEQNVTLGHAVPFVMTALNLRLGLWVGNPAFDVNSSWINKIKNDLFECFSGLFFACEMTGKAQCRTSPPEQVGPHIHLSDGGHFENLALYELIRRHCRYIIVSDAGEDQEFGFSDFGRAVRRVREDFGVEIEIDLTGIQPGPDGHSQQHVAVGSIYYDGIVGTDKGIIVYIKPTLTGDEPVDVLQYQKRKHAFPHESTGDQFFDEAQFESYRRLGEHTANASLKILEPESDSEDSMDGDQHILFHQLRLYWQRVPWLHTDGGVRLCKHAVALEDALQTHTSPALREEFISDLLNARPLPPTAIAQDSTSDMEGLLLAIRVVKFL